VDVEKKSCGLWTVWAVDVDGCMVWMWKDTVEA
jgi:hypothetical protein